MQCPPRAVVVRRPIEDEPDRRHSPSASHSQSRSSRRSSVVSTHSHSSNHGQVRAPSPSRSQIRRSSTTAPFDSPPRKRSSSPPPVHILPSEVRAPAAQPSSPCWSSPQSGLSISRSSSVSSQFGAPLQGRVFSFTDADADSIVEPSPPSSGPSSPALFPGCSPPSHSSLFSSVAHLGSRLVLPESQYSAARSVPAIGPFPSAPSPVGPPSASRSFSSPMWPLTPSGAAGLAPVTARSVSAPDWPSWSPWAESRTTGILSGLANSQQ